jgi:hypothetical protein
MSPQFHRIATPTRREELRWRSYWARMADAGRSSGDPTTADSASGSAKTGRAEEDGVLLTMLQ